MSQLLSLLAAAIIATTNIMDKYLVHGDDDDSSPSALLAIGGLFNLLVALCFLVAVVVGGEHLLIQNFCMLILNGLLYTCAIYVYFKILFEEEVSVVIPWYQTIPLFGLVGGIFFLSEFPGFLQLIGIVLLVIGGFKLSVRKGTFNYKLVWMMLLSSLLIASNDLAFAYFGREMPTSHALLGDLCGKAFFGLLFLLKSSNLRGFKLGLRTKFWLMAIGELMYIFADNLIDIAKLHAPVAIVQAMFAVQPLFVLIGMIIMTRWFNKVICEDTTKTALKKKVPAILLMVLGGIAIVL